MHLFQIQLYEIRHHLPEKRKKKKETVKTHKHMGAKQYATK